MKFLFDLHCTQAYGDTKFHGGGMYGRNLFIFLVGSINKGEIENLSIDSLVVTRKNGIPFDETVSQILLENHIPEIEVKDRYDVVDFIRKTQPDIFYSPLPESYNQILTNELKGQTKFFGTIHGLRDFEIHYTKDYVSYQKKKISRLRQKLRETFRAHYLNTLKKSYNNLFSIMDGFITVSEHSKHQILLYFPSIKPESVKVIFPIHFTDDIFEPDPRNEIIKTINNQKYFLLLNCNRPVKNVKFLIEALNDFYRDDFAEYKFLCVGFNSFQISQIKKRYKRIFNNLIFIEYVENDILAYLYKHSFALIFPSISEGFGYPSMEAMKYKTPVLAANLSAIPEVCAEAALYFNPYDKAEIVNRILQLIHSSELRNSLIEKGIMRYDYYKNTCNSQLKHFSHFIEQ